MGDGDVNPARSPLHVVNKHQPILSVTEGRVGGLGGQRDMGGNEVVGLFIKTLHLLSADMI